MRVIRPGALALAGVIAAPALWQGFVAHGTDAWTALVRYLIAVPIAALMLGVFDWLVAVYRPVEEPEEAAAPKTTISVERERRRAEDHDPSDEGAAEADRDRAPAELPIAQDPPADRGA